MKAKMDASFIKDILGLFLDSFIKILVTQSICKKIDMHMELISKTRGPQSLMKNSETMFYS